MQLPQETCTLRARHVATALDIKLILIKDERNTNVEDEVFYVGRWGEGRKLVSSRRIVMKRIMNSDDLCVLLLSELLHEIKLRHIILEVGK